MEGVLVLGSIGVGLFFLFRFIHRVDQRRKRAMAEAAAALGLSAFDVPGYQAWQGTVDGFAVKLGSGWQRAALAPQAILMDNVIEVALSRPLELADWPPPATAAAAELKRRYLNCAWFTADSITVKVFDAHQKGAASVVEAANAAVRVARLASRT